VASGCKIMFMLVDRILNFLFSVGGVTLTFMSAPS